MQSNPVSSEIEDKPVYLASYKHRASGLLGLVNRGIQWVTRSRYSHTELCIGHPFEGLVHCITSSGMDGGVRCKRMQLNPAHWDVLPMPWVSESAAWAFMLDNKGAHYDYMGVVRFLFPWALREHPTRWFCTEAVAHIAGFDEPWRYSPADFHQIIKQMQPRA